MITKMGIKKKEIDEKSKKRLDRFRSCVIHFFNEKEVEMLNLIGLGLEDVHLWNWSKVKFCLDEDRGPNYQQSLEGFGSVSGWKFVGLVLMMVVVFVSSGFLMYESVWCTNQGEVFWCNSFPIYLFIFFAILNIYLIDGVINEKKFNSIRFVYHLRHLTCRFDAMDDFSDVKENKQKILFLYKDYLKKTGKDIFYEIDKKMDLFVLIKEHDKSLLLIEKLKTLKREDNNFDMGLFKKFPFHSGVRRIHEHWIVSLWEKNKEK